MPKFRVELSITGIQEAQDACLRWATAVQPKGALGRAVQYMTVEAQRRAVELTHVDTGALRASHRIAYDGPARGRVFIDGGTVNPRSRQRTAMYGYWEHERGGEHAFYARVVDEYGATIRKRAVELVAKELT